MVRHLKNKNKGITVKGAGSTTSEDPAKILAKAQKMVWKLATSDEVAGTVQLRALQSTIDALEKRLGGNSQSIKEQTAELTRRMEEAQKLQNDPDYLGQLFAMMLEMGTARVPADFCWPSIVDPHDQVLDVTVPLLLESESEPKIEEAVAVLIENCFCGCSYDRHSAPSGASYPIAGECSGSEGRGGCPKRCGLFTPQSAAWEARAAHTEDGR
jgi:hypothetical protein